MTQIVKKKQTYLFSIILFELQTYLGNITGSISGHCNKVNIAIKRITHVFVFLVHIKVMFILYCSLLSVL